MSERLFALGFTLDQSAEFVHVVLDGTSFVEIKFAGSRVEVITPLFRPAADQEIEVRVKNRGGVTLISAEDVTIEVDWESRKITLPSSCEALLSTKWLQDRPGLTLHLRTDFNMEDHLTQNFRKIAAPAPQG